MFGELLRRFRLAAGLTQERLAAQSGLSVRGLSDLERGQRQFPRADTVELLAAALRLAPPERAMFLVAARTRPTPPPPPRPEPPAVTAQAPPAAALFPIAGRERELDLLQWHLDGAAPPVLLFAGEPGIGKSRLLQEAARRAVTRGMTVLVGGCHRRAGQQPFAPVLDALDQYIRGQTPDRLVADLEGCAWLVRLLPELAGGPIPPLPAGALPPAQERRLMVAAVGRFLHNVAGPPPTAGAGGTLLLLDDLQWAGEDACDLLAALARTSSDRPLRILGAYRDIEVEAHDPLGVLLADLAQAGLITQRTLDPLEPEAVKQLLDALLFGMDRGGQVLPDHMLKRAGGVPFFLVSLAQDVAARGGAAPTTMVPWSLSQSVRQRVAALSQGARALLEIAAIIGRRAPLSLLLVAAQQPEEQVLAALEAATRARLLVEDGMDGYRFAHDVLREVVEAELGAARRAALHRRVAEALAETEVEALAYHYARGAVPEQAAHYLEQAGDRAQARHAAAAASEYYREAVDRLGQLGRVADAARVREKLGALLFSAGQLDAALDVLEMAAEAYQAAGDELSSGRVIALIGRAHADRGTPEEGLRRIRPLVRLLETHRPSQSLGALYIALAYLVEYMGRYDEQLTAAECAIELARTLSDTPLLAEALVRRAVALNLVNRVDEAVATLEEASGLAESLGDLYNLVHMLNHLGCVYEDLGDLARARRYTERALAVALEMGNPTLITFMTTRRGHTAFLTGDWASARADHEQAVTIGRQLGPSWAAAFALLDLGRFLFASGAWPEAVQHLEESRAVAERSGNLEPLRYAQSVLAEHDLWAGQPEAARTRLLPLLDRPGLEETTVSFVLPLLAWAELLLGNLPQAETLVNQGVSRARAANNRRALVDALRIQALVLIQRQCWELATRVLEEGGMVARGMPYPYAEARLLFVSGLMFREQGDVAAARDRLEGALAIFRRLQAYKDIARTEQTIASLRGVGATLPLP